MSELKTTRMKLFQVVGRKAPTKTDENPPAFRMKLFAVNEVIAKSRFWYFMHQMRKMKKTTGEILDVNEVRYGQMNGGLEESAINIALMKDEQFRTLFVDVRIMVLLLSCYFRSLRRTADT